MDNHINLFKKMIGKILKVIKIKIYINLFKNNKKNHQFI
jgi:hypothetical protein